MCLWLNRPRGLHNVPLWFLGAMLVGSAVSGYYWLESAKRAFMPLVDYTNGHSISGPSLVDDCEQGGECGHLDDGGRFVRAYQRSAG